MNERYKRYYTTLIGKITADQFLKRFQGKKDSDKYSTIQLENEKYWILNTTRTICKKHRWSDGEAIEVQGALYYSLYMHKEKDMAVLKAPIMGFSMTSRYDVDNNIRAYTRTMLRKMGYTKCEFDLQNKVKFGNFSSYVVCPIKILIPKEKSEDDLSALLMSLDRLNDYIRTHNYSYWEDANSIAEFVKFDPMKPLEDLEIEELEDDICLL